VHRRWTEAEIIYTEKLIEDFNKGVLPISPGEKLTKYLSQELACKPDRIRRKLKQIKYDRTKVFAPIATSVKNKKELKQSEDELYQLKQKFTASRRSTN